MVNLALDSAVDLAVNLVADLAVDLAADLAVDLAVDSAIDLARDFIVDAADKNLRAVEVVCRFYDDLRRQGCSRVVWATRNHNNMGSLFAGLQRIIGQKARKYSDAA